MQIPSVSPVYNLLNHVDGNQFKIYDLKSVFCTSDQPLYQHHKKLHNTNINEQLHNINTNKHLHTINII
jgi:hypothetical protein